MSKGRRYDKEPRLNLKKVFAVLIALMVILMFLVIIKKLLTNDKLFSESKEVSYFSVLENNKWGVINSKGESVIPTNYEEMIIVPDNTKPVFLYTYDINEETGEYKTKVLNEVAEEIFTKYDKVEVISNVNSSNNSWYEENVLKVKQDGKYGLINLNGKEILDIEYDNIYAMQGVKNSIIIVKNDKVGLVNASGTIIVPAEYKEIIARTDKYIDGYITINQDGLYGLISNTKKELLKNEYQDIEKIAGEKYFVVKKDDGRKIVNTDGKVILELADEEIVGLIETNTEGIIYKQNDLYGLKNILGEVIINPEYQDLRVINKSYLLAKQNDKYGIIDIEKNVKLPIEYGSIYYNEDANIYVANDNESKSTIIDSNFNIKIIGILIEINKDNKYIKLRVNNEYKYYTFDFEEKESYDVLKGNTLFITKQDGKYGFNNKKKQIVVSTIYDDVTEQNKFGFAGIKKNGLWGVVNSKGEVILEPEYNLDANLFIDFIGKWHLGIDLNMNYYCK